MSLLAVGDDDQNIYAYDGASVGYIRKFEDDYRASPAYLTENYRSSRHIITAGNAVIEPACGRLKQGHPIVIDRMRSLEPAGGRFEKLDPVSKGHVQILPAKGGPIAQAQHAIKELTRLAALDKNWRWDQCAVIARRWNTLHPVRAVAEAAEIKVQSADEEFTATLAPEGDEKAPGMGRTARAGHLRQPSGGSRTSNETEPLDGAPGRGSDSPPRRFRRPGIRSRIPGMDGPNGPGAAAASNAASS